VVASPTPLSFQTLTGIADRITSEVKRVCSVTYNIAKKPPSTIEAVKKIWAPKVQEEGEGQAQSHPAPSGHGFESIPGASPFCPLANSY
jgi:hypothetical protein